MAKIVKFEKIITTCVECIFFRGHPQEPSCDKLFDRADPWSNLLNWTESRAGFPARCPLVETN